MVLPLGSSLEEDKSSILGLGKGPKVYNNNVSTNNGVVFLEGDSFRYSLRSRMGSKGRLE